MLKGGGSCDVIENILEIIINDKRVAASVAVYGDLGAGEAYINSWYEFNDENDLKEVARRIMESGIYKIYLNPVMRFLNFLEFSYFNLQTKTKAKKVAEEHYDLGE